MSKASELYGLYEKALEKLRGESIPTRELQELPGLEELTKTVEGERVVILNHTDINSSNIIQAEQGVKIEDGWIKIGSGSYTPSRHKVLVNPDDPGLTKTVVALYLRREGVS